MIQFILSDKHLDKAGRIKSNYGTFNEGDMKVFHITLNEVMWPKKFSYYMQGLKSAILALGGDELLAMLEGKI